MVTKHFCDICDVELSGSEYYEIRGQVEHYPGVKGNCIIGSMVDMELCDICMRTPRSMKDCLAPDPDTSKWRVPE